MTRFSVFIFILVCFEVLFVSVNSQVRTILVNSPRPQDCDDVKTMGYDKDGVYEVYPNDGKDSITVYCSLSSEDHPWLVFQRRNDGSVDFYETWDKYLIGFGNLSGEFWLGNENIHRLTKQRPYQLKIDLEDWEGVKKHALYGYFSVGPVSDYFRLFVHGYSGDAGDSLSLHHGYQFSAKTLDRDTSVNSNCAALRKGAWWYYSCDLSNLNGQYLRGKRIERGLGINWYHFRGYYYSLKMTEMKIRPQRTLVTK